MRVTNPGPLRGQIKVPGDKSVSHRAAILLAISDGNALISNFADGDDCASTLKCLGNLGVQFSKVDHEVSIKGVGIDGLKKPADALDCGNSGTTMRLLAGLLAGQPFESKLIGDKALSIRPMERIAAPLRLTGADIDLDDVHAPIGIRGRRPLNAIDYRLPVASAQVKSSVLCAGLYSRGGVRVISPGGESREPVSRDHTERMLRYLGADIQESYVEERGKFCQALVLQPQSKLPARDLEVPGDISTAAFLLVAAAGLRGSDVILKDVGLNPTRTGILDIMKESGIRVTVSNRTEMCNEPRGDLRLDWNGECELVADTVRVSGSRTAAVIDEIPILAVMGTLLPGGLEIRDAQELRVKESDRIRAIVSNLKLMGADVVEFGDGFRVAKSKLTPATLDSYGDHRIAMAFTVAAMFAEGESVIDGTECVSVSYPGFFDDLDSLKWK